MNRRQILSSTLLAGGAQILAAHRPGSPIADRKIRVAQIGTIHAHAAGKWDTPKKFPEHFEVIGIHEPDAARLPAAKAHRSYRDAKWISEEEILERADLVVIETDIPDLVPTALRCVRAGKHLHLDKPGGTELPAFTELIKAAEKRKLVIQMGYMFRYNPAFQFLFRAVRESWLGEIREVHGVIGKRANDGLRKELGRFAGGGMFELGCHLVDATLTVLGSPDSVTAFNHETREDGVADNQLAVFQYPKATATLRCNHVDPFGSPRRQFSVTGEHGTIEIRPLEPPRLHLFLEHPQEGFAKGTHEVELKKAAGRYDGDFLDLAKVLKGKTDFTWSYQHDIATHKAVLQSSGMPLQ